MDALEMKALFEQRSSYENVPTRPGELSHRERFLAIMGFEQPDRIVDTEFGYWDDTLRRWHSEGLPKEVNDNSKADTYFGFDAWHKPVPVSIGIFPDFEEEIVRQDARHTIKYDNRRVKCQVFTDGSDTIPHYLDFPIKDRDSYLPFKERFQPLVAQRVPADLSQIAEQVRDRNYVLTVFSGSTFGLLRDLMGFEGICYAIYEQPELLDEALSDLALLYEQVALELTRHLRIDAVVWWEDIAFKTGPIVGPQVFREKAGPVYKRAMDVYRAHGAGYSWVDCDGDNRKLVPTWLETGVNIIFPLEVNAGVHPESLRRAYPGVRMMGGFDKLVLLRGKQAIKDELLRLKPLVHEGGFIPHVDHRVQADVSFKDYLYYLEAKRDIFEIPNRVLGQD